MNGERPAVGVIGLGAMGGAMARRLLEEGWPVVAYDPLPDAQRAVAAAGAIPAGSPQEVGARAPLIITSLPGERELREVLFGQDGVVREASAQTVVIDTSTLTPDAARRVHADLHAQAVAFLDAPVSGGPGGAAAGSLVIMVGGDRGVLDRAGRLFESLGAVFHCGGPGAGQVCKACNQLVVVGTIELVAEALVLAEAGGLDPALVRSALLGGYAASRVLDLHGARMLGRDFSPGGRAKFNLKDIDAIEGLAAANGLALPAFAAAATQINRLIDSGGGELDNAALITVLEDARMVTE